VRIQKYLSQNKILSRREAESFMLRGLVKCNGAVIKNLGFQMDPEKDKIEVLGSKATKTGEEKITVAVNKPKGFVCSRSLAEGRTVFDLLPQFKHLNTVGRLDKESEGLILLSNDGVITSAITGDEHKIEKEYEVTVRETVLAGGVKKMEEGMMLDDGPTLPARAKKTSPHSFNIILKEGRKHQIRRMADVLGLTVTKLRRVRIGNLKLGGLGVAKFRILKESEAEGIKDLVR
jgi:23S rRNA pseudouridine2605 synthase